MNRHRYLKILAALVALAWAGAAAAADVPGHISYQGMLQDGDAPFTGEANFRFALVDSLTNDYFWTNDGTAGYPAEAVRIPVQDGVFSVLLGAPPMPPIEPSALSSFTRDQALRIWVEIGSHGEVLLGNLPLSSVLFAHQAELARASDGDFVAAGEIWSQSGGFRFPDGTVQETAAAGSGGGDCLWSAGTGSKIYYNAGNVGIGTDDPTYPLSIERSAGSNIVPMTLFRTTGTNSAAALRFQNALENHFNLGITGGSHLALGYNANIGLSGDVVRVTPDGNVGIGRTNPTAKLDVNGSVRMTGLQLGTSATAGHVLTTDASGVGTWQPAPTGGESYWQKNGSAIYYDEGNVGIGTTSPYYPLHMMTANSVRGVNIVNERVPQTNLPTYGLYSAAEGGAIGITDAKNIGVAGKATNAEKNYGVSGSASNGTSNYGVRGSAICTEATLNYGVYGTASGGTWNRAIYGSAPGEQSWAGYFVGRGYFSGNVGIGSSDPIYPLTVITNSQNTAATFHNSEATSYSTYGISSQAVGEIGGAPGSIHTGIKSTASNADWNFGVYATASNGAYNYAGYFIGDTHVTGTLSKGAGSFKIDHPLDPANKYLSHSFVESLDMMNIYNGNVVTDGSGRATIDLPDWFEALNRDYRYQLTVIDETDSDEFVQAKIVRRVENGSFAIRTSAPNVEVSWQVTGIRQDAYANAHRIPVEEDKPSQERGTYLHPEALGLPADLQVDRVREARTTGVR